MDQSSWLGRLRARLAPGKGAAAFRTQRLKIAMLSSLAGKGVSIVAQLVALPLAIGALGIERFGMYAMLVALLNWMNVAGVAIAPGLTVEIVSASAGADREREARVFSTAFLFALAVSAVVFVALQVFFHAVGVGALFGQAALVYEHELAAGLQILSVFLSVSVVLSVVEATQAGYQNQYVNNVLGTAGSVLSILAIVLVVRHLPTIPNLILAIFGAPLVARVVNMVCLLRQRRYLWPRSSRCSLAALRRILATGSAFLLTLLGTFCYQSFSVYWAGRELGSAAAAQVSIMMLVMTIAGSLLMIVTQPLWPAIQDAASRNDYHWIAQACRRLLRTLVPYVALAALVLAAAGQTILQLWLASGAAISTTTQLLWGLYFFIVAWEHINYTVLMGLSRFWYAALRFSAGALCMLGASVLLTGRLGMEGLFLSLCLGPLVLSAWMFPLEIRRRLAAHRALPGPGAAPL